MLFEWDILSLYLSVIFYKVRKSLRQYINFLIFNVCNLPNKKFRYTQLPIKLIFGWVDRIKLVNEIWEGPAWGIGSGTTWFVTEKEKDGSQREGDKGENREHESDWLWTETKGDWLKGSLLRSEINVVSTEGACYPFKCKIRALLASKIPFPLK